MANNALKLPFASSQNRFAAKKINDALQLTGKALPCTVTAVSGAIVTVSFEILSDFTLPSVTVAVQESIYVRLPIQVGDLGIVQPADARLGGITGLGAGTANLSTPGNLAALTFVPVSSANWPAVDGGKVVIAGPTGVLLSDATGAAVITVDKTAGITLSFGGRSIVLNATAIYIDGKEFLGHMHTGVQSGGSDTGGVA